MQIAELAIFSLAVAITITSAHFAYPRRVGQAELAWTVRSNTQMEKPANFSVLTRPNIA